MSTITATELHPWHALCQAYGRLPPMLIVVLLLVLAWAGEYQLSQLLQLPGQQIRGELSAAAAELDQPVPPQPSAREAAHLRRLFGEPDVRIDVAYDWPDVVVTLDGVDQAACLDAEQQARRIDGRVVVALEGYASLQDCRDRNTMTWRITP